MTQDTVSYNHAVKLPRRTGPDVVENDETVGKAEARMHARTHDRESGRSASAKRGATGRGRAAAFIAFRACQCPGKEWYTAPVVGSRWRKIRKEGQGRGPGLRSYYCRNQIRSHGNAVRDPEGPGQITTLACAHDLLAKGCRILRVSCMRLVSKTA